jgi:DMSO reductase anchor subunit
MTDFDRASAGGVARSIDLRQRIYRYQRASLECNAMLENPIVLAALTCFLLGLVLSGLARVLPGSTIVSAILPIIFLTSYVLTYQQVPDFPPIGATNKIFYIALAAALIGFALDLLPRTANYRKLLAVITPLLIVAWIGFPRFAKPDIELMATALGLWLGGLSCYGASRSLRRRRPSATAAVS